MGESINHQPAHHPEPACALERAIPRRRNDTRAAALERHFALDTADVPGIRERTEEIIGGHANSLGSVM